MSRWTEADIPDQSGRTVLVTGANSGLGLQTALVLAERAATVLRGQAALPQLYAAAAADVRSGEYFRPTSLGETRGTPGRVPASLAACNEHTARLLWERTAQLTGVAPDPA